MGSLRFRQTSVARGRRDSLRLSHDLVQSAANFKSSSCQRDQYHYRGLWNVFKSVAKLLDRQWLRQQFENESESVSGRIYFLSRRSGLGLSASQHATDLHDAMESILRTRIRKEL